MKITELSLREKVLQTVCLRHKRNEIPTEKYGALFFGGEIITEAEDMGLDKARRTIAQYTENAPIPMLVTSDFENGCGSMIKGLTPFRLQTMPPQRPDHSSGGLTSFARTTTARITPAVVF